MWQSWESGVYNWGLGPGLYGLAVEAKDSLAHSGFQVKVRRSRRHTLTTARQEARQPSKAAAMFLGSVAKGFGVHVLVCAAPGATPLERCANGAGCTALGAPANEEGGVASGAARLTPRRPSGGTAF